MTATTSRAEWPEFFSREIRPWGQQGMRPTWAYLGQKQKRALTDYVNSLNPKWLVRSDDGPKDCDAEYLGVKLIYCEREDLFHFRA